jgi:hypothetical protein
MSWESTAPEGDADSVIARTSRPRLHDIVGFSPEGESYNTQTRAESRPHARLRAKSPLKTELFRSGVREVTTTAPRVLLRIFMGEEKY